MTICASPPTSACPSTTTRPSATSAWSRSMSYLAADLQALQDSRALLGVLLVPNRPGQADQVDDGGLGRPERCHQCVDVQQVGAVGGPEGAFELIDLADLEALGLLRQHPDMEPAVPEVTGNPIPQPLQASALERACFVLADEHTDHVRWSAVQPLDDCLPPGACSVRGSLTHEKRSQLEG